MAATNLGAGLHAGHLAQVFAQYPIEVAHGDGVWLHARDGRKILDFYGGHAVAGLGYGHPRWLAACWAVMSPSRRAGLGQRGSRISTGIESVGELR